MKHKQLCYIRLHSKQAVVLLVMILAMQYFFIKKLVKSVANPDLMALYIVLALSFNGYSKGIANDSIKKNFWGLSK